MSKGVLIVMSNPASAEREAEYNEWYDNTHVPEIVALPEFESGRRYKLARGTADKRYLAIYETAVPAADAAAALGQAIRGGSVHMSDAIEPGATMLVYEPL